MGKTWFYSLFSGGMWLSNLFWEKGWLTSSCDWYTTGMIDKSQGNTVDVRNTFHASLFYTFECLSLGSAVVTDQKFVGKCFVSRSWGKHFGVVNCHGVCKSAHFASMKTLVIEKRLSFEANRTPKGRQAPRNALVISMKVWHCSLARVSKINGLCKKENFGEERDCRVKNCTRNLDL